MRIGIHISAVPDRGPEGATLARITEMVKMADHLGFARITTGDTEGNILEVITALTYMSTITERALVGPHVMNPRSRHPAVVAAALTSLDLISQGRAFLVLGTGDGAVRNLGLTPATRDHVSQFLRTVRDLLATGRATYHGTEVRCPWPWERRATIPLYVAAEGPKMLALAGAIADGVYVGTGLTPDVVAESLSIVQRGAAAASNDRASLDIWWGSRSAVAESRHEALQNASLKEHISAVGKHALDGDYEAKRVPPELHDRLRTYHARYDYGEKGRGDRQGTNVQLMEQLGLTEYFLSRFGLVGTPDEVVHRLQELHSIGVHQVTMHARTVAELRLIGEKVLPRVA